MADLPVAEAEARARTVRVTGYDLDLDLDRGAERFGSSATITFERVEGGDTETFVDVALATIDEITFNGTSLDPASVVDERLPLASLAEHNTLTVRGEGAYSHDGEGLHRSVDPTDGQAYVYQMSFLGATGRVFACFDQPDLKSPYRVAVTVPEDWLVLGNAPARQVSPGHYELNQHHPLSTYFTCIVAGPYHQLESEHDGIPLGLVVKASLGEHLDSQADDILTVTRQAFDAYHEMFGFRYPFAEYHQAFVPEFNAGAMENPGCVTFRDQYVPRTEVTAVERASRATTVVHEMAHQWFGDTVTMRWWNDLWLNESFAEYMAHRVAADHTAYADVWVDFSHVRKWWGLQADRRPSTHPVAPERPRAALASLQDFDGISYAKGASVLKQLSAYLGDDVFLAGIRDHIESHAFGNATFADLVDSWTGAGAVGLDQWAAVWLRSAGVDTLTAERTADGVRITRTAPTVEGAPADAGLRPHRIVVGAYGEAGATEHPVLLDGDSVDVELPPDTELVVPDCRDDTWAAIRLDEQTLEALEDGLPALADPLTRAVVWNAVRGAVADASLDPRRALRLAAVSAATEDSQVAVMAVLAWALGDVIGGYLPYDPADTAALHEVLDTRLRKASDALDPGLALALVRGWLRTAPADAVEDSLTRGALPGDVELDVDLTWRGLIRLARLGVVTEERIAAQQAADPSSEGELQAIRCRTARPDVDAKSAAWRLIASDGNASNYAIYAACEAFWDPARLDLTEEYADRFFTELPATAGLRSGWVLGRTVMLGYPSVYVDDARIAAGEAMAADESVNAGMRRSAADGVADVRAYRASRDRWSPSPTS